MSLQEGLGVAREAERHPRGDAQRDRATHKGEGDSTQVREETFALQPGSFP